MADDVASLDGKPTGHLLSAGDDRHLIIQAQLAEYSALTTRATCYTTLQAGIWPLIAIYLAFIAQLCKPDGVPFDVAFHNLLGHPVPKALLLWANLFVIGLMLKGCSQFIVEQYKIVLYIERHLRPSLRIATGNTELWGYERFLAGSRNVISRSWEYSISTGYAFVLIALCCISWPLTCYDGAGIVLDGIILLFLARNAFELRALRLEWGESLQAAR